MSQLIVVKNVCGGPIALKEITLQPNEVKRLDYDRLRDNDLLQAWSRGHLDILDWPPGKDPISHGDSSPAQYQLPQGTLERYGAWWPKESA